MKWPFSSNTTLYSLSSFFFLLFSFLNMPHSNSLFPTFPSVFPKKSDVNNSVPFECRMVKDPKHSKVKIKAPSRLKKNVIFYKMALKYFFVPQTEVPTGLWITQNWFKILFTIFIMGNMRIRGGRESSAGANWTHTLQKHTPIKSAPNNVNSLTIVCMHNRAQSLTTALTQRRGQQSSVCSWGCTFSASESVSCEKGHVYVLMVETTTHWQ